MSFGKSVCIQTQTRGGFRVLPLNCNSHNAVSRIDFVTVYSEFIDVSSIYLFGYKWRRTN